MFLFVFSCSVPKGSSRCLLVSFREKDSTRITPNNLYIVLKKFTSKHLVFTTQPHRLNLSDFCIERLKNWNWTVTMPGRKSRKRKFTKDLVEKYKYFSKTNDPFIAKCNLCNSVISIALRGLSFSTSIFFNLLQFFNFRQKHELVDKIYAFFMLMMATSTLFRKSKKIVNFFLAIPGHNANFERNFSLIKTQWTNKRNRLLVETVRDLIIIKFNVKSFTCSQFYKYLLNRAIISQN